MMSSLRAGVVGLGMMGRHHVRVLRELEGVDLVAIADPNGDQHGVAGGLAVLPDVQSLISVGVDLAIVAVPTQFHEETALALAEAGVHTLIEKPIAHSAEAGRRIVEAFRKAGVLGAVGHVERFNPALQQLRMRLEAGDLGEVYQIATRRQGPFPARIADVGAAKDLASHDVDLSAWIAQTQYEYVFAQTAFKSGRDHEDLIAITARLESGVVANHLVNWLSPIKERVTVVSGERGAFVADTATGDLTFFANGTFPLEWESVTAFRGVSEGDVTRFAFTKREPLRVEHEAFRDAVLGEEKDFVTLSQGLRTLEVVEAGLKSALTGAVVKLVP